MIRILMVCLGNICRSPLAEGILKSKLPKKHFTLDSAGTGDYHIGHPPDLRSIAVAKKYGIDISTQKARQFNISDFDSFDYIYAMDHSNYNNIVKMARHNDDISKVKIILNESSNTTIFDVPDPYFDDLQRFEEVYQILDNVCTQIANKLTAI